MFARLQAGLLRWRRRFSRTEWARRYLRLAVSEEASHATGLLLVQIDGLGREQFERALARRRMPFLRRLLKRRGYQLHTFYSGIPSSTPAVQGELHYGVCCAVPAFSFLDRRDGTIGMMYYPEWAKRIEADLAAKATGLLKGGSSWSNIYTGGAGQSESHFCAASIGLGDMWRSGKLRTIASLLFFHFPTVLRLLVLVPLEFVIGLFDALQGVFFQHRSILRELGFLCARVLVCVGLREVVTLGAAVDLARGLPIVHVNFVGYDEQAHRRGPGSAFAHWTLKGIDRAIRRLHRAARHSGRRDYDIWIFSDHGQARTTQARQRVEDGLEGLVRKHWPDLPASSEKHRTRPQVRRPPDQWLGGRRARRREERQAEEAKLSVFEKSEFAVAALGPVGLIYFGRPLTAAATRHLAAALVRDGVPGVLLKREDGRVDWLTAKGEYILPDHEEALPHEGALRGEVARDLAALCQNAYAGDIIALGFGPDGERWTFADENGSHAGPSPEEVQGFAVLPPSTWLPGGTEEFVRPSMMRVAALHLLGREHELGAKTQRARRPQRDHLRVATYNAHGCYGYDGRISPARIARVLDQLDADVIAIQELDAGRTRSRSEDQLADLAASLGFEACFCPAVVASDSSYGHGILCRERMRLIRRGRLPGAPRGLAEPREAMWVSFPWNGCEVNVLATHLGLGAVERARQVDEILADDWLGSINGKSPVILCGDFNLPPGTSPYRRIVTRYKDVQAHAPNHVAGPTFPSFFPLRRIDHIFVSSHFEVLSVEVPRNSLIELASDHLPVVANLMLR